MSRTKKNPEEKMTQISVNLPKELLAFVESQKTEVTESYSLVVRRIVREAKERKESL